MTILGTCPECGGTAPLDAYLADLEARRALAAALRCPESLAAQIPPYLALFAPGGKRVQARRLASLLDELASLVGSGQVTRSGDTRAAPLALWVDGIAAVLDARAAGTLDLPLKSHGLLAEIVHRRAGRAALSQAQSACAERSTHASQQPFDAPAPDPQSIEARRAEVAELVGERARLVRLLRLTPDDHDARTQLAAVDARLSGLGIDPAARPPQRPKPRGLTALRDLIRSPQEPTP